jgi:hypothetical protein
VSVTTGGAAGATSDRDRNECPPNVSVTTGGAAGATSDRDQSECSGGEKSPSKTSVSSDVSYHVRYSPPYNMTPWYQQGSGDNDTGSVHSNGSCGLDLLAVASSSVKQVRRSTRGQTDDTSHNVVDDEKQ